MTERKNFPTESGDYDSVMVERRSITERDGLRLHFFREGAVQKTVDVPEGEFYFIRRFLKEAELDIRCHPEQSFSCYGVLLTFVSPSAEQPLRITVLNQDSKPLFTVTLDKDMRKIFRKTFKKYTKYLEGR